jgi:hypothetical protein
LNPAGRLFAILKTAEIRCENFARTHQKPVVVSVAVDGSGQIDQRSVDKDSSGQSADADSIEQAILNQGSAQ